MKPHPAKRRARNLVLASAALAGAGLLLAPPGASFVLVGPPLGLDATHVRVFNNFADAEANDHATLHEDFPGYVGAPLSIWKASVEWGAALHGDGGGDPTQPGDLGSGGSNFSPSFQGDAIAVGAIGDNVHSAIASLPGGVVAFTEVGAGGWRIRYNDQFVWDDDPAGPAAGTVDLQTVATHEYGHALGLGHTASAGCVMTAALSGTIARDLCADDQAGVQALYGAAAPGKPLIAAALVDATGVVSVHGQGFAPASNEVWFTKASPGGVGPVKLTGVTSSDGGTRIEVALPAAAGPGDVLVRAGGGVGLASLSNAWPLDLPGGVSCGAVPYGVGLGGANGIELGAAGPPEVGATLVLELAGLQVDGPVLTLVSAARASLPLFGGVVLIDPAALVATLSTAAAGGVAAQPVAIPATPGLAGARVFAQSGQLDPGAPAGLALSNGLELVLCP